MSKKYTKKDFDARTNEFIEKINNIRTNSAQSQFVNEISTMMKRFINLLQRCEYPKKADHKDIRAIDERISGLIDSMEAASRQQNATILIHSDILFDAINFSRRTGKESYDKSYRTNREEAVAALDSIYKLLLRKDEIENEKARLVDSAKNAGGAEFEALEIDYTNLEREQVEIQTQINALRTKYNETLKIENNYRSRSKKIDELDEYAIQSTDRFLAEIKKLYQRVNNEDKWFHASFPKKSSRHSKRKKISERKKLTTRAEIDEALERLDIATINSLIPSAMCYSMAPPRFIYAELKCDLCGKKFLIELNDYLCEQGKNILPERYNKIAMEFTKNGFKAELNVFCRQCMSDFNPSKNDFFEHLAEFRFWLPKYPFPLVSYPSLRYDKSSDYKKLLWFLNNEWDENNDIPDRGTYIAIKKILENETKTHIATENTLKEDELALLEELLIWKEDVQNENKNIVT